MTMSTADKSLGVVEDLLRVDVVQMRGQTVLVLAGEIDLSTASAVRVAAEECLQRRPGRLAVDLRDVRFCDCSGLRALRWAARRAVAQSVGFQLQALSPAVLRVFTLAGADDMLAVQRPAQFAPEAGLGDPV